MAFQGCSAAAVNSGLTVSRMVRRRRCISLGALQIVNPNHPSDVALSVLQRWYVSVRAYTFSRLSSSAAGN